MIVVFQVFTRQEIYIVDRDAIEIWLSTVYRLSRTIVRFPNEEKEAL